MNQVAIVTDSTATLPKTILDEFNIQVIPLTVIWDEETFADGIDLTPSEFYIRLANSTSLPSTSQPPAAAFKDCFRDLLDQGKDVAAILISS